MTTTSENPVGKILVVDDEVELKNALVEALTAQSYEARGYTNGQEALEALRVEDFDVLVSDLMMPEMDGITLVKAALEIDPHLVAIIMTGQGTIQTAVDAMKAGTFDYVLKPFRLGSLMPVLTRAINTRRLRKENLQLRETVAIYELAQTIAFTLDQQTVISKLADAALQQTEADEVSVLLPVGDSNELYVAAVRGENRERLLGERIPLEQTISSWVARERMPVIVNGEVNDGRFAALWPRPDIRSAISVPMQVANKLVGIINLNMITRSRPFNLGQMKALTILASTAAAALESASLYEQVRHAEQNYRSIFENAVEGIFQSTSEGRFLTANPAMARILGYDSHQEVIATFTDIARQLYVDPERAAEVNRTLTEREVLEGFEFEAYRKDRQKIWLSLNNRLVRDENGNEICREGTIEDITERKRAEEMQARRSTHISFRADVSAALALSRAPLQAILDICAGAMVQHLGAAFARIWTLNREENVLELQASAGIYTHLDGAHARVPVGKFKIGMIAQERAPHITNDVQNDPRVSSKDWAAREKMIAFAGYPLIVEDRLLGVMAMFARQELPGDTLDALASVADIISQGIERKRAEEERERLTTEIENQRQRLDNIISSVPGVVWEAWGQPDAATQRINFVSDYVEIMLGYTVEEWLSTPNFWLTITHPDDKDRAANEAATNFAAGKNSTVEFRWVTKDGRAVWIESNYVVIKDDEGQPVGLRGVTTDISERRGAEEALRESEERYRDLVENAHDIIYSHDLDGNYTSINKAGEQITGYTREEALTLNISETVAPEYLNRAQEMLDRKLAGENVTAYELELLAKDGRRVAVEANTKLVFQEGVAVGVQGIARDVTERRQLEDQLRQSQKMEAVGQLAGGIAHDFNNLLTAINGYSSLALQGLNDDSQIRSYLEEVKKAGERAANLTRQLLAFGRKQILQPTPLNLNDVVADMNKMLRRLIGEDIQLTARFDPGLSRIKADAGQIEQVLVNLVVNARDAMPQGGHLTIETANVELDGEYAGRHVGVQSGRYVMLAVSDTGVGMDEQTQARIFEPFFTTKEKGKGTGLGLSTVYGIVKQSGGNIWVYSEPDQGTAFKVYLPRVEGAATQSEPAAVEVPIPKGSETILLVEDEDVVRGLARKILERAGYNVLEASRGEEAVRLSSEHPQPIHLLLTDVVMPEASGKQVAERLRALRPDMKVLFMSGYTDEAIVHHGILDSTVEFIEKPFTPDALARKVRKVLDNGQVTSDFVSHLPLGEGLEKRG